MGLLLSYSINTIICLFYLQVRIEMNSILDQYNNKLATIYQQFVSKNDDITSILEQDDVDAFINYISNQKVDIEQYENCYDQGLLHMACIC